MQFSLLTIVFIQSCSIHLHHLIDTLYFYISILKGYLYFVVTGMSDIAGVLMMSVCLSGQSDAGWADVRVKLRIIDTDVSNVTTSYRCGDVTYTLDDRQQISASIIKAFSSGESQRPSPPVSHKGLLIWWSHKGLLLW